MGLVGPWFTFFGSDVTKGVYIKNEISPFVIKIEYSRLNDPFGEVFSSYSLFFYGINTSLVGLVCIIGAIAGVVGGVLNRPKLFLTGGILDILGIMAFATCMPGHYIDMQAGWGGIVSTLGIIVIIMSAGFGFMSEMLSSILNFIRRIIFKRRTIPFIIYLGVSYSLIPTI
jgi:hypothetical protein